MCRLHWVKIPGDTYSETSKDAKCCAQLSPFYEITVYKDIDEDAWFFNINDVHVGGPFSCKTSAIKAAEGKLFEIVSKFYEFLGGNPVDTEFRANSFLMKLRSIESVQLLAWEQIRKIGKPTSQYLDIEVKKLVGEIIDLRSRLSSITCEMFKESPSVESVQ